MNKEVVDFIAFTRWVKESLLHFEPQGVADFAACLRARAGKHLLRYKGFGIVITIAKALSSLAATANLATAEFRLSD